MATPGLSLLCATGHHLVCRGMVLGVSAAYPGRSQEPSDTGAWWDCVS